MYREPARSVAEHDVVSKRWRRCCKYLKNHSPTSKIKRQIRRRERRKLNENQNETKDTNGNP